MKIRVILMLALLTPLGARAQTGPQPPLPTETVTVVTHDGQRHPFKLEMAQTSQQQETGLMFRASVPDTGGMIFDWGQPRDMDMWMKNTLVPLDMLFVNADGSIRHIAENTVPQSLAHIGSGGPIRAVIELRGGITEKLDIEVGDRVEGGIFTATAR